MSALWRGDAAALQGMLELQPMTTAQLDAVMAIEVAVYPFPWSRGNFIDSLASGYVARVLCTPHGGSLLGYFVAMPGFEELHLLNITVASAAQGQGHARTMFEALLVEGRRINARELWLEVRVSNLQARAVYAHLGFAEVGQRKGYYPAAHGLREDAVVMSRSIPPTTEPAHALE